MTIDSTWLHAFKEEAREAFTKHAPFHPTAVFSDGQIRLMQGGHHCPKTWDDYVARQFAFPLRHFFETCDTVILAFDNYAHVPMAKCMTQQQRRRNVPCVDFSEHNCLPGMVPRGEEWTNLIANRTFKAKVIDMVILMLPSKLLRDQPARKRLIVDYQTPVSYTWNADTKRVDIVQLDGLPPLGEADIKFPRYADLYGRLMVDSIDGDSVPISLIHHEARLSQGVCPPRVCIYRMEINPPASKRKREEVDKKTAVTKPARSYEYLDIQPLYQALRTVVLQSIGRTHLPLHSGHEVRMLVSLICLTGTDFSRGLPQVSGKTVYEHLPAIWMTLAMSYDPSTGQLRNEDGADRLVALIYHQKFPSHVESRRGIRLVLSELERSKISQRTKDTLPTPERIETTVRNVNWVLQYWTCAPAPDPLDDAYGYRAIRGRAQYLDLVA